MSGLTNPLHLAFIAVIALVVLGPKRLPELARTIGNGLREFREAISMEGGRAQSEPAPAVEAESTYPVAPPDASAAPAAQPAAAPEPAEQELRATAAAAPTPAEQELAAPPPSA
jgi:sec-independent protein translocase protein TatA